MLEDAVLHGDFYWHALPFTTHSELLDPALFRRGLAYSQDLDRYFGRKTVAAKMTDVPGHTRGIVPLLAEAGVRLLHIGVNPASTVPAVPPVFRWRCRGREITVIYEKVYGATTVLPGNLILSVHLTGDNLGPQDPREIARVYEDLEKRFPDARLKPSSLNDVAEHLWKHRHLLPVIENEIGDTWIHGAGSDPGKMSGFRELCRLRNGWVERGILREGSRTDWKLSENLLLVAEHTWGMDIKTHLKCWDVYAPPALKRALNRREFRLVEESWAEQREYLKQAVAALPARLKRDAESRLKALKPVREDRTGWEPIDSESLIGLGNWSIRLHRQRGFIKNLVRNDDGRDLADSRLGLAAVHYETFSREDYDRFFREYNTCDVEWARLDFTKEQLPRSANSETWQPSLRSVFRDPTGNRLCVVSSFPSRAVKKGAPATVETVISAKEDGLEICLQWFDKAATRMPESLWFGFAPRRRPRDQWIFEKLGVAMRNTDVVRDGNRHLHAVTGDICLGEEFRLNSLDAILVAQGKHQMLRHTNQQPTQSAGISFNLYNNVWGTNFPMWNGEDAKFRFRLKWARLSRTGKKA